MKTESELTRAFCKEIKHQADGCRILSHADRFNLGVPDRSITWWGKTVWVEAKRVVKGQTILKRINDSPAQRDVIKDLALQGARHDVVYVIYDYTCGNPRYSLVNPDDYSVILTDESISQFTSSFLDYCWYRGVIQYD